MERIEQMKRNMTKEKLKLSYKYHDLSRVHPLFLAWFYDSLESNGHLDKLGVKGKYVCVNLDKVTNIYDYAKMLDYLHEKYEMTCVFVALGNENTKMCKNLMRNMRTCAVIVENVSDECIFGLVKNAVFTITNHIDMLVLATNFYVPCVSVIENSHTAQFALNFGQSTYIDKRSIFVGDYKNMLDKVIKQRDNISRNLENRVNR